MIGLLVLAVIAFWFAIAGTAAAPTEPMVPCHAASTEHDAQDVGGHAGHPHQDQEAHRSGSCCTMSWCHAAIAAVAAGVYLPPLASGRIGGQTDWTWQEAGSRLERPPRTFA
ncbi:hypothetical protein ABIE65_004353 [Constrictibacter sp. MBR-5]|jgi:hypothetical protein|uniref:hypothetical protein n=1 Tax=Constrictibacter sp. MBR-5 TaxID=3156467 RepID=UPI0033959AD5